MRCLTLADALQRRGATVRFVSRVLPVHLQDMAIDRGHQLYLLDASRSDAISCGLFHASWLGVSQKFDAGETLKVLADHTWDWLIIDHYAIDALWEKLLRKATKNILVIDDIADRDHDCDLLLDQNLCEGMYSRYKNKVPDHCKLLLGPCYALLREEFGDLHKTVQPRTTAVRRILIFFGGVDHDNLTTLALIALNSIDCVELTVDVVLGANHPYMSHIKSICSEQKYSLHVQTSQMAELMAAADLGIGASGSATWERCCMGLPALTISVANNQTEIAKGLEASGAGIFLGMQEAVSTEILRKAICKLMNNSGDIENLSKKALALVDGLGVYRCLEIMEG